MTAETTDRVMEGKEYRQKILDKLDMETSNAETLQALDDRDTYIQALEDKVEELKATLDEMTAKSKNMEKEVRAEYQEDVKMLEMRYAKAKAKLDDIRKTSGEAWKELQNGAFGALREFGNGLKNAVSKFW